MLTELKDMTSQKHKYIKDDRMYHVYMIKDKRVKIFHSVVNLYDFLCLEFTSRVIKKMIILVTDLVLYFIKVLYFII